MAVLHAHHSTRHPYHVHARTRRSTRTHSSLAPHMRLPHVVTYNNRPTWATPVALQELLHASGRASNAPHMRLPHVERPPAMGDRQRPSMLEPRSRPAARKARCAAWRCASHSRTAPRSRRPRPSARGRSKNTRLGRSARRGWLRRRVPPPRPTAPSMRPRPLAHTITCSKAEHGRRGARGVRRGREEKEAPAAQAVARVLVRGCSVSVPYP